MFIAILQALWIDENETRLMRMKPLPGKKMIAINYQKALSYSF